MTGETEKAVSAPAFGTDLLQWSQVESFFKEHGCVIVGDPELLWYRESWCAMEKASLTCASVCQEFEPDWTVPRLRAICLLAMYLGIYQAAGEFSELGGFFSDHPSCSWYLNSLNVNMEGIWTLARQAGVLETGAESYREDSDADDELLDELAMELVSDETDAIFEALVDYYGGKVELFASLWKSRTLSNEDESLEEIVNAFSFGDGKLEVWMYVEEGMKDWRWA